MIVGQYYKSRRTGRTVLCLGYGGGGFNFSTFHGVVVAADDPNSPSFSDKPGYECEHFVVSAFTPCEYKDKSYEDML
jgi:hypothetical protein